MSMVSPELSKHVTERLQTEASILKERRAGREERQLAAKAGSGSGDARPPGEEVGLSKRAKARAGKAQAKSAGDPG